MTDPNIATTSEKTTKPTKETPKRYRCRHIFIDGHRCGSPSLRDEPFCYYHHTTRGFADEKRLRRTWAEFELPPLEDRSSVLAAINEVLQRIAGNNLPAKEAGLLLYGLQIASLNLPEPGESEAKSDARAKEQTVEEVISTPPYGDLAPTAEIIVLPQQPSAPSPVSGTWTSSQTQPEENPSLEQEPNRVPHLRDGLIVAKVGEAEQAHPETTKAQPANPGAPSPALEDMGEAPPTPTQPEQPQPITLHNLHANGVTYTSLGAPSQRKFTPHPALPERQSWYPDNCHANEKRTPQPPHSAHRHQAAQRRRSRRRHAVDGLQLA
jgi:hypothetical protein